MNIKKLYFALTVLLLLFSACKAQDKIQLNGKSKSQISSWEKFISEEAKFKVEFPAKPQNSIIEFDIANENRKGKKHTFEYIRSNPELNLFVISSDMPTFPNVNDESLKTNYDFVQNGVIQSQNAKLLNQKDIYINKHLGREITIEVVDTTIKYQMYLIGNRQYQIITSTPSSLMKNKEIMNSIEKFLDSFEPIE